MNKLSRILAVSSLLLTSALHAQAPTPAKAEFFTKKIKPLLETHCFKCHSHASGKSKGNLVLDSLASMVKGGDSGPALVPGQPEKSLLLHAVRYAKDELRMPPTGKLPDDKIALLAEWIKMGAPWPGGAKTTTGPALGKITDEDRRYWAFQPVKAHQVPDSKDPLWAKNPIDRFVLGRLHAEGLRPSPPAERAALVRRIYADLVGLPPSPQEIDAFVADTAADAYEKLVDRLLASPRYGEKWARHWLDLVRYAESDGYRIDEYRPQSWQFRDYVIRSLNADKPYDRFVQEQLAGDEMFPDNPDALTATAYLRHWIYEYNQRDVRTQWQNILEDLTDVTGEAILGLGMGCARCHDHKFDAILQKDYYRLQAFFAGIQPQDYLPLASQEQQKEYYARLAAWEKRTATIRAQIAEFEKPERANAEKGAIDKFPPDIQEMIRKTEAERTPFEKQLAALAYRQVIYEFDKLDNRFKGDKKDKLVDLRRELAKFDADKPAPLPRGLTVRDVGLEAPPIFLPRKNQPVEPGFLTVLDEKPAAIAPIKAQASSGRRTALAKWLTSRDNPLTTRVIVNRLWQHHFGQGLVNTPSDFGRLGDKPSHPELLDWLARRFVEDGWSLKKMHRLLVTSQTYRQAATAPAPDMAVKKDPQNRLLWRASTRRLQAEQIRDALLSVTGRLDLTMSGPSVDVAQPRRTIYTKMFRNNRDPLLDVFDAPEGVSSVGQRNVTTTPTQALLMINSPFMLQQAQALAARLQKENSDDDVIRAAFRLTFGRSPSQNETQSAVTFLNQQAQRINPRTPSDGRQGALVDFCHVLLNANEFLYID